MGTYNKDEELKKNNVAEPYTLKGVDDATADKAYNSTFTASDNQKIAQNTADDAKDRVASVTDKKNIISGDVMNTLNSSFTIPTAVKETDAWISSQLQKIQSGKTSYSDQVKDIMAQIQGREKFSYDVDSDPLFQQALSSAMSSGKQAMQDTIGQASSLTGGYGSTYATTAGNQAYNAFIEDAYDNLPQYYQMAMEAYQMEGDELYRQLGMFNEADDKEYNRNITAYDATYQHRNRMYDEAYQLHRDSKTDAYNMANLQLSEHGQLVSDAVNNYNVMSDYANTKYGREYQTWSDEVNQAMQYAQMLNGDWWSQTNFDEGVRQYDQNFTEQQRQYSQNYAQTEKWNQKDLDYKNASLAQDNAQFSATMAYNMSKDATKKTEESIPSAIKSKAAKFETNGELETYLDSQVEAGLLTEEQADYLYSANMIQEQLPFNQREWTMVDNGGTNWFGGIDGNGVVKDQYDNSYSIDDLYDELKKTMSKDEAKSYIKNLQKSLGITKK